MGRKPKNWDGPAQYVLSLSYGKDSLACLGAIEKLGWSLDRIVHAEVWATDTIPADLPEMIEFKAKADAIIKERWGIEVEHRCATRNGEKMTYEKFFYHYTTGSWCNDRLKTTVLSKTVNEREREREHNGCGGTSPIRGFPIIRGNWCLGDLKRPLFSQSSLAQGAGINIVQYLGIAADEPERIERHRKPGFKLPLVEAGWDEAYCRQWCEENDLLSPIYTSSARGGCWFCHNQGIDQLRLLRRDHPELWALLMKWDLDSPVSFKPDGHTIHDFDLRFELEDTGKVPATRKFRWKMLEDHIPQEVINREKTHNSH